MINNCFGKSFQPTLVLVGYFIIALGLVSLLVNIFIAILFMLTGVVISFSTKGVELDPDNRNYREYFNLFGFKLGSWNSYDKYPFLAILKRNFKTVTQSNGNVASLSLDDTYYDIFMLTKTHRGKVLIKRATDLENSRWAAQDLAQTLGLEYAAYNPAISVKTQARRAARR